MVARTPGPWRVEVDDQSGIGRTHAVYICGEGEWPESQLARVNIMDGFGEREANARLLAAAPTLLEALLACREQFDFYAAEHRRAEKHEKAGTNEKFAFICSQAINFAIGVV